MPQTIEIKLALAAALPLIEQIRAMADTQREVQILLDLFKPPFDEIGVITINQEVALAVLRAGSFIRLQLRRGPLAAIPDELLEDELDANQYTGSQRAGVHCYQFLIQVQAIVLDHFPGSTFRGNKAARWIAGLPRALANTFRPDTSSQIVLRNDPVNSLRYVSLALQREIGLSEVVAKNCADEINQAKSAVVWRGSHAQTEARVRALQAWHLDAVMRS
jgi:ATP-dependent Clp protease adapter protein ClpS